MVTRRARSASISSLRSTARSITSTDRIWSWSKKRASPQLQHAVAHGEFARWCIQAVGFRLDTTWQLLQQWRAGKQARNTQAVRRRCLSFSISEAEAMDVHEETIDDLVGDGIVIIGGLNETVS